MYSVELNGVHVISFLNIFKNLTKWLNRENKLCINNNNFYSAWTNMKISKEIEERRRLDELRFQRAGKGPIVKTYNYDPTKQTEPVNSSSVSAKKGWYVIYNE